MTRRVVSCGLLGRRTCLCVRLNDGTCVKAKRLTRWIWTEAAVCGLTVMKVKHCRWHRSGHFKRTTSCGSLTNALRRQRLTTGARIRERKGTASLNKRLSSQVYSSTKGREKKKVEGSGFEWREKHAHDAESFDSSSCVSILTQTAPHVLFQNKTLTYVFFLHVFLLTFAPFYGRKPAFWCLHFKIKVFASLMLEHKSSLHILFWNETAMCILHLKESFLCASCYSI